MPKVSWGVDAGDVDDFDRDSQYKPYAGPQPPRRVYVWRIKTLKYAAGSKGKNPQLRPGLELVPREENTDEKRYAGYFVMDFLPVANNTTFRYVPFLDVLGVSGRDFANNTLIDDDGNVKRIGKWRNDGQQLIAAELVEGQDQDGNVRWEIRGGSYCEVPEDVELSDEDYDEDEFGDDDDVYDDDVDIEDDEDDDDDYEDEDDELDDVIPARREVKRAVRRNSRRAAVVEDDDEEEDERPKARRGARSAATPARSTKGKTTRSRRTDDEGEDDEPRRTGRKRAAAPTRKGSSGARTRKGSSGATGRRRRPATDDVDPF